MFMVYIDKIYSGMMWKPMVCTWHEGVGPELTSDPRWLSTSSSPVACCSQCCCTVNNSYKGSYLFLHERSPWKESQLPQKAKRKWNMPKKVMVLARNLKFGMSLSVECCIWLWLSSGKRRSPPYTLQGTRLYSWNNIQTLQRWLIK